MRYFGGKFRVRKAFASFIQTFNPKIYLEPFCGSAWVAELVKANIRICTDMNSDLIAMWQAVQDGWEPPSEISEREYQLAKLLPPPNPLRAFIGFGCSYAGKFFGGYARGGHGADAKTAKSQVVSRMYAKTVKSQGLEDVIFAHIDYKWAIENCDADVVYCDPPYKGTTKFYGLPDFDTAKFWEVVRMQSAYRTILTSEYSAPAGFREVLSIPTRTDIRSASGQLIPRVERLYKWAG